MIDVGAGRGQFALFALKRFPNAVIHSFEPLLPSYRSLEKLARRNDNLHCYAVALGNASGNVTLHVTQDRDSSSLRPPTLEQVRQFPGTEEVAEEQVPVRRLGEVVKSGELAEPVLLKLDVQGFELDVLSGAEEFLPQLSEVLVECSFVELYRNQPLAADIIRYLDSHGLLLRGFYSPHYDRTGACVQADLLFSR